MDENAPSGEGSGGKCAAPSRRYLAHQRRYALPAEEIAPREVYFVLARKMRLVKIGRAVNARERMTDLQVGSPDKLELLGVIVCERGGRLELELHRRFERLRSHGEWFRATPGLLNYVTKHAAEPLSKGARHISDEARQWEAAMEVWRAGARGQ